MKLVPTKIIRALILGGPASGKGTISSRISKEFDLHHLSAGDLLRSQIALQSEAGRKAKSFLDGGRLVPDQLVIRLVSDELRKIETISWVLDGYPRTIIQAEHLVTNHEINVAICLDVPDDEIISRISGRWIHLPSGRVYNTDWNPPKVFGIDDVTGEELIQRPDDQPDVIKQRLEVYHENMSPILELLEMRGLLKTFHGRESNVLWPKIKDHLKDVINKSE